MARFGTRGSQWLTVGPNISQQVPVWPQGGPSGSQLVPVWPSPAPASATAAPRCPATPVPAPFPPPPINCAAQSEARKEAGPSPGGGRPDQWGARGGRASGRRCPMSAREALQERGGRPRAAPQSRGGGGGGGGGRKKRRRWRRPTATIRFTPSPSSSTSSVTRTCRYRGTGFRFPFPLEDPPLRASGPGRHDPPRPGSLPLMAAASPP